MLSARSVLRSTVSVLRVQTASFTQRLEGTVKFFDVKKGYGFITMPNNSDVFVHQTSINKEGFRSLALGETVEFELAEKNGKSEALNVTGPGGKEVQGAPRHMNDLNSRPPRTFRNHDRIDPRRRFNNTDHEHTV